MKKLRKKIDSTIDKIDNILSRYLKYMDNFDKDLGELLEMLAWLRAYKENLTNLDPSIPNKFKNKAIEIETKIEKEIRMKEFTLQNLVAIIYRDIDDKDQIERDSLFATIGFCNCAISYKVTLTTKELTELKELYKSLGE